MLAIRFTCTIPDYIEAEDAYRRSRLITRTLDNLGPILGLLLLVTLSVIIIQNPHLMFHALPAVLIAFGFITQRWWRRRIYGAQVRQHKRLLEEQRIAFHENHFVVDSGGNRADTPWSDVTGWLESANIIQIIERRTLRYVIPKRDLSEAQLSELRSLLQKKTQTNAD